MTFKNSTPAPAFSDRRVFFVHDGNRAAGHDGSSRLRYEQSANGPTITYIADDVSDSDLAMMADRHGLMLQELQAFRDQPYVDRMLATPARRAGMEAEPA